MYGRHAQPSGSCIHVRGPPAGSRGCQLRRHTSRMWRTGIACGAGRGSIDAPVTPCTGLPALELLRLSCKAIEDERVTCSCDDIKWSDYQAVQRPDAHFATLSSAMTSAAVFRHLLAGCAGDGGGDTSTSSMRSRVRVLSCASGDLPGIACACTQRRQTVCNDPSSMHWLWRQQLSGANSRSWLRAGEAARGPS